MHTQGEEKWFWQQSEFQNNKSKVEYLHLYPQVIIFLSIYAHNTFQIATNHWKYNPIGGKMSGEIFVAKTNMTSEGPPCPPLTHLDCKAKVDYL